MLRRTRGFGWSLTSARYRHLAIWPREILAGLCSEDLHTASCDLCVLLSYSKVATFKPELPECFTLVLKSCYSRARASGVHFTYYFRTEM